MEAALSVPPRLLTDAEAAAYLAIPTTSLRRLNVGRVVLDGRVRWDRLAIDSWLDQVGGLTPPDPARAHDLRLDESSDAAFQRFIRLKRWD